MRSEISKVFRLSWVENGRSISTRDKGEGMAILNAVASRMDVLQMKMDQVAMLYPSRQLPDGGNHYRLFVWFLVVHC